MAICRDCGNEMTTGASCVVNVLHQDGTAYALPPYTPWRNHRGPCGDCGVEPGGLHHLGCDLQDCPRCRRQLISCDCRFDELADEYDDPDDEDEDDDTALLVVDEAGRFVTVRPAPGVVVALPFAAAVAPVRALRHHLLDELAALRLPGGAPVDVGLAVVLLGLLDARDLVPGPPAADDALLLRRPQVHHALVRGLPDWCAAHPVDVPPHAAEHLWALLGWLAGTGRLHAGSDPLESLLEPLQCHGGLDAGGLPRAADALRRFHCQCRAPFDPTLPPGRIAADVNWVIGARVIEHLVPPALDGDDDPAAYAPLWRLAERVAAQEPSRLIVSPPAWRYLGRTEPSGHDPVLWFYRHVEAVDPRDVALAVDADGTVHEPRLDRRRRRGFRWVRAHEAAVIRCAPLDLVLVRDWPSLRR